MPVLLVRVGLSPDWEDALRRIADVTMPAPTPPPDWAEIVPTRGRRHGMDESTARLVYEHGYHRVFAEDAMAALSPVTGAFPRIGLVAAGL